MALGCSSPVFLRDISCMVRSLTGSIFLLWTFSHLSDNLPEWEIQNYSFCWNNSNQQCLSTAVQALGMAGARVRGKAQSFSTWHLMGMVQVRIWNACQNRSQQLLPYFSTRWRMSPFGPRDLSSFKHCYSCTDTDWLSLNSIDRLAQVTVLQSSHLFCCSHHGQLTFSSASCDAIFVVPVSFALLTFCTAGRFWKRSALALRYKGHELILGQWGQVPCKKDLDPDLCWSVLSEGEGQGLCYWFGLLCLWESRFWWLMLAHCTRVASNFSLKHGSRNTARWYFFPGKWFLFYGKWKCFVSCKRP